MDGVFTPIFVILMVSLLLECLSLLLYDFGMALCARIIILMLLYLAFVIKRRITNRSLKHRSPKMLRFHNYVIFCVSLTSIFFHSIMLLFLASFRSYCTLVILVSLPVALDEYLELQWLRTVEVLYKQSLREESDESASELEEGDQTVAELRPSLYYTAFKVLPLPPSSPKQTVEQGIV